MGALLSQSRCAVFSVFNHETRRGLSRGEGSKVLNREIAMIDCYRDAIWVCEVGTRGRSVDHRMLWSSHAVIISCFDHIMLWSSYAVKILIEIPCFIGPFLVLLVTHFLVIFNGKRSPSHIRICDSLWGNTSQSYFDVYFIMGYHVSIFLNKV